MIYANRLQAFRDALSAAGLDGFIINRADMYQGEEVRPADERLEWLTGFTGSAGTAVIISDRAAVFSDSLYHVQMERELDSNYFELQDILACPPQKWIKSVAENCDMPLRIGVFGWTTTKTGFDKLVSAVEGRDISFVICNTHFVDALWTDRPDCVPSVPFFLSDEISGRPSGDKCEELARYLEAEEADYLLLTAPDSVNWLLNMRARDLACTPVLLSFALVSREGSVHLITETEDDVGSDISVISLQKLSHTLGEMTGSVTLCDPARLPVALYEELDKAKHVIRLLPDKVQALKAVKNPAEIKGFRDAHICDGCAMVRFWHWFEQQDKASLYEHQIAERVTAFRSEDEQFICDSFPAIAGWGAQGAIIHYRAVKGADKTLSGNGVLLLDSGGHYQSGTTDITRCFGVGDIDDEMRRCSTAVFAAHVTLATAQFPTGTTGAQLDAICRAPLWAKYLDYGHGTGHGVGHLLSVHEGPVSISPRSHDKVETNYVLSNEPGTYRKGTFGIRHENLILSVEVAKGWIAFETLTMFPFDISLINTHLLSSPHKNWLNTYHRTVKDRLSPHLPPHLQGFLAEKCALI